MNEVSDRPDAAGVYLVDVTRDEAPALTAIYGDPKTTRMLSFEPKSLEQVQAVIDAALLEQVEVPRRVFLRLAKVGAEVVGVGRLQHEIVWPGSPRTPSACSTIGLAIRSDCVGRGFGRRVLDELVRLAWDTRSECETIWGAVDPDNAASAALLKSRGFERVDLVPEHVTRRGMLRPSVIYALQRA